MDNKSIILDVMKAQGRSQALSFRTECISQNFDGTKVIDNEVIIPNWRQGPYDLVGAPVRHDGQVYKVLQPHDSTGNPDWSPDNAVSLFDICHTKDPDKAKPFVQCVGTRGMYHEGEVMIWEDGNIWRSNHDNNSYTPATYPAWWELIYEKVEE